MCLPSKETEEYWIYATREKGRYPKSTQKSGKWLVFVDIKDVDNVWGNIKKATEEGKLGNESKVATIKKSPVAYGSDKKVICVYSYNWTDEKDVNRIREELRKIGITNKIPYKTDEDTSSGKYRTKGYTNISKYYE